MNQLNRKKVALKKYSFLVLISVSNLCLTTTASSQSIQQNEDKIWVSSDYAELVLQSLEKGATFYFNNDSSRYCYSFNLPGKWQPSPTHGLSFLVIEEPGSRTRLETGITDEVEIWSGEFGAVWIYSPDDLASYEGDDLLIRASQLMAKTYEQIYGTKLITNELMPYQSSRPGTKRWVASWSGTIDGELTQMSGEKIFTEVGTGWVAQISFSSEAIAENILQTLSTSTAPDCYIPFINMTFFNAN